MKGCVFSLALVAPFWIATYLIAGWEAVAWMVLLGAAMELVLFRDDWLGLLRRLGR